MKGNPQNPPTRLVKLQYKDYEEGEFTGIKERTAGETLQLISEYPWAAQRDHLAIGLTNPSVTIEGPNNDFLKLSPWYNGKYVLHYFDAHHHLFTHSFDQPSDSHSSILALFEAQPFDPAGFRKEITWLQSNKAHFATGTFCYSLATGRLIYSMFPTIIFIFATLIAFTGVVQAPGPAFYIALVLLIVLVAVLVPISSLLINHYRSVKGKVLILSRGKEEFSFGATSSPATFNKMNIREIVTYGRTGRSGYYPLTRVEIQFIDGRTIDISCLMISQETLIAKFPHCRQSVVPKTWPFITPAASALFE